MQIASILRILICWSVLGPIAQAKDPPEKPQAADEAADEAADGRLIFREPFFGLSASEAESKLVLFLVTDQDPMEWAKAKQKAEGQNRLPGSLDVWCGREFRRSFQDVLILRPDLKDRCIVQRVVAGLPANLTGGTALPLPPRALVAICDGHYRLLNFSVGVPQADDLIDFIEQAEENQTLLNLNPDEPETLGTEIVNRSHPRIRRVYQDALSRLVEKFGWDETLSNIDEAWELQLASLVSELEPVFLFDAKLRFALSSATDRVRLLVLEQHVQTRENWCASLLPFLIGRPMQQILAPLIDCTWRIPPVIKVDKNDHKELLEWFAAKRANSIVVLSIRTTRLDQNDSWPPHDISVKKSPKRDWHALETAMSKHAFRNVSVEQLAAVIADTEQVPINLYLPSRARYVFYEPGSRKTFVIRESDLPIKFTRRLK